MLHSDRINSAKTPAAASASLKSQSKTTPRLYTIESYDMSIPESPMTTKAIDQFPATTVPLTSFVTMTTGP